MVEYVSRGTLEYVSKLEKVAEAAKDVMRMARNNRVEMNKLVIQKLDAALRKLDSP